MIHYICFYILFEGISRNLKSFNICSPIYLAYASSCTLFASSSACALVIPSLSEMTSRILSFILSMHSSSFSKNTSASGSSIFIGSCSILDLCLPIFSFLYSTCRGGCSGEYPYTGDTSNWKRYRKLSPGHSLSLSEALAERPFLFLQLTAAAVCPRNPRPGVCQSDIVPHRHTAVSALAEQQHQRTRGQHGQTPLRNLFHLFHLSIQKNLFTFALCAHAATCCGRFAFGFRCKDTRYYLLPPNFLEKKYLLNERNFFTFPYLYG